MLYRILGDKSSSRKRRKTIAAIMANTSEPRRQTSICICLGDKTGVKHRKENATLPTLNRTDNFNVHLGSLDNA